ncbi:MAG: phenylalanine--tRNA ligase subunit beta [candidate division WOR-3 bacterium]
MKVLYNTIKEFIPDFNLSPIELKNFFEDIGIEVENFLDLSEGLKDKVFPAIVESIKYDGNLKILKVKTNFGEFQVITTADISLKDKVVLAIEGARLKNNQVISKRSIKNYISEGMLLSESEIGISEISDRIIKLPIDFDLNSNVLDYLQLNDYLYELYIFPNRGDLMGMLGICYEIASYLKMDVILPNLIDEELENFEFPIEIEEKDGCLRYIGTIIKNVKISDSPDVLRYRLHLLGFRSINNIVDITNYVMWEIGQPLHAFDLNKIDEKIIVRRAKNNESILCLDGTLRNLNNDILVIADKFKPIAIAGIIGGEESSINNETKDILLESAFFNKEFISKASRILKIKTESSKRFEKGLNWEFVEIASKRASYLIKKYANGKIYKPIDVYKEKIEKKKVIVNVEKINEILGTKLSENEIEEILKHFGIKRISEKTFSIPYHRDDIENYYDLSEEIMKFLKIDKIPSNKEFKIFDIPKYKKSIYEIAINFLFPRGYYEAKTFSLISEEKAKMFSNDYLRVLNPLSSEMNVYRNFIISSLMDALSLNIRRNGYGAKLLEFGKVYRNNKEFYSLGIVAGGKKIKNYFENEEFYSPYELKGDIEALFEFLNYHYRFEIAQKPFLKTCLEIYLDDENVGFLGEVKRSVLKFYNIKYPVYVCEVVLKDIKLSKYEEISKFPKIEKDISILIKKEDYYLNVEKFIKSLKIPFLVDFYLIDVYEGPSIGENYRSLTFRLVFNEKSRTLKDEEVNEVLMEIIQKLEGNGYKVRRI